MAKTVPGLLLAHSWDGEQDVTGWWMSEKLDGVRAYWDGKRLISRLGNQFQAPKWFTAGFPKVHMDGELWMGRKMFERTSGCVRKLTPVDAEWKQIRYLVFDLPMHGGTFEKRRDEIGRIVRHYLEQAAGSNNGFQKWSGIKHSSLLGVVQQEIRNQQHMLDNLRHYIRSGAEGLMLRQPESLYETKRSKTLLKVKQFETAEGKVIGHEPGKGKHLGRLGALVIALPGYKKDKSQVVYVGTGFTDAEREKPPRIGSTITYRFQELTNGGIPRFPAYVGVRRVS